MRRRSGPWLLEQLPRVMQEDPFIQRYVGIYQEVADSLREQVEAVPFFLDLSYAPDDFVGWMAGWMGLSVEPNLPDPELRSRRMRDLVRSAGGLFMQRGTRGGLEALLIALTGSSARVEDGGGVFRTGAAPPNRKQVRVIVDDAGGIDEQSLHALIEQELPADTSFELVIAGHTVVLEAVEEMGHLDAVMARELAAEDGESLGELLDGAPGGVRDADALTAEAFPDEVEIGEEPAGLRERVAEALDQLQEQTDEVSMEALAEEVDETVASVQEQVETLVEEGLVELRERRVRLRNRLGRRRLFGGRAPEPPASPPPPEAAGPEPSGEEEPPPGDDEPDRPA